MKKITKKMIISAQYGDLDALDQILDEFSKFAYYHALKILKNRDDTEDCVQMALSYLVKNLHSYSDKDNHFYGWTHTIIDSAISKTLRSKNRYNARVESNEDFICATADNNNVSGDLLCMLSDLERHIGSEKYQILFYKFGCNYKFTEMTKIFGCSLSTIKRKYAEALQEARKYFGEINNE